MQRLLLTFYDLTGSFDHLDLVNSWFICVACVVTFSSLLPRLQSKHYRHQSTKEKDYNSARTLLKEKMRSTDTYALFLRLAWSDAATYDKSISEWPRCGGANGRIRFNHELDFVENRGLIVAITLLENVKDECPLVSWADLIQMSGALAVELLGGPKVHIKYGRVDAEDEEEFKYQLAKNLPRSTPPYADGAPSAGIHIRCIFYRMGLTNRDIVALSGAHTIGRAFRNRSGVCPNSSGDQGATSYTRKSKCTLYSDNPSATMAGGKSWTKNWLHFDNSYFTCRVQSFLKNNGEFCNHFREKDNGHNDDKNDLIWLPSDQALIDCPEFRIYFLKYAKSLQEFFHDYAVAHKKMSELGCKFSPAAGFFVIDSNENE